MGVVAVFGLVYLGMFLGRLPGLQIDRTGIALLGAIVLVATGGIGLPEATAAVDVPTLAVLFAFMVVSAQLRLGGFFGWMARRLADAPVAPPVLLAFVIGSVAVLSAVFSNDIVCLATAPVLVDVCRRRGLSPLPFLLALALAANIGSAATLIGNPQNILVGEGLDMDFGRYAARAISPVVAGLFIAWAVLVASGSLRASSGAPVEPLAGEPALDPWQSFKGLAVGFGLVVLFLLTSWPRELAALAGAGLLLTSRRLHSREVLGLVDWQLLVLFAGLFIVNAALAATPVPAAVLAALADRGITLAEPAWLYVVTALLSNLVSNVPAIMLLLPYAAGERGGTVLALSSTLAGNFFVISSIANIIVVEAARRMGVAVGWREHARVGVPVALLSLAAGAYLVL